MGRVTITIVSQPFYNVRCSRGQNTSQLLRINVHEMTSVENVNRRVQTDESTKRRDMNSRLGREKHTSKLLSIPARGTVY